VNVTVPLDHFNAQDERRIDVVFGVLPATGERQGMFVTVVGGPGSSGLLSADAYTSYFDPGITEHFDVVFFDQRGVNLSGGLQCAQAAADFYRADWDATTPTDEENLLDVAQTFVEDCIAEMGDPEILPYLDTVQAVEDVEAFRRMMGDEQLWLYGESYGTQFAQTYAASHPDRLAGLILDGTVDLTLTDIEFLKGQAQAFNDVLVETLQACNDDALCAEAMGHDALAVYDGLAARLKQAPLPFDFPLSTGGVERREFTFPDLEATTGYLYSETARMLFLRALAAYARDDTLVPLARVLYNSLYLDPDTLQAVPDPSYSDAVYYAVTCRDYAHAGNTPEERALGFLRAGDEMDASLPRMASVFYGDLPCVFWPYPQEDQTRPAPLKAEGIPTLVLNATTDPATPYSDAVSVYSRLADGYLVTETGGPHVIFGWGNACVDSLVAAFLVEAKLPAERETVCEGVVASEFVPLAPLDAAEFENPLEALASVDDEIYYLPEYYYWDYTTPTAIACPFGGTLAFESSAAGETFMLTECAFSDGFVMTGHGSYDTDQDLFTLKVSVTGLQEGALIYTRDGEGTLRVTGVYGGETIDLDG
jgi:pimeloyl-ACP methyl ester carboxylesterase